MLLRIFFPFEAGRTFTLTDFSGMIILRLIGLIGCRMCPIPLEKALGGILYIMIVFPRGTISVRIIGVITNSISKAAQIHQSIHLEMKALIRQSK